MPKEIRHTAYLIRWQEEGDQIRWRSTVENAYTGEKFHFVDKIALLRFLSTSLFDGNTAKNEDGMPLENVHTHETSTFATERELLIYLLQTPSEKSTAPVLGTNTKKGENNENH